MCASTSVCCVVVCQSSSAQTMFEEMCSERSQLKQLPDRDNEANEEDLWEEKELTFSPLSTTTPTTTTPKRFISQTELLNNIKVKYSQGRPVRALCDA